MTAFAPGRLTIARQRRAMYKQDLAALIGVSDQAITAFEKGDRRPLPETVERMAFALRFPFGFFFDSDVEPIEPQVPSFRSRRSMGRRLRDKVLAMGTIAADIIYPAISKRFTLPKVDIPNLAGEGPDAAAEILREYWKLGYGPIDNMVYLLEAKGARVMWLNEPAPELDAFSLWRSGEPFVMLNLHKTAGDRGRYDAAHELGHLVLHRDADIVGDRQTEKEADQFAAAFLLPAQQFSKESPRQPILTHFFPLKQRWGVAIAAMVRRSRDVGVFTEWDYICACKEISRNGWRTGEPVPILREESQVYRMIFAKLAGKGTSPQDFAREVNLHVMELADVIPTVHDYLQPQSTSDEFDISEDKQIRHLRLLGSG